MVSSAYPYPPDRGRSGMTLIEMMVVVSILGVFVSWASLNLFGVARRHGFRAAAQEFLYSLQTAAVSAAESDRRYEVIIDLPQQTYLLREITTPDLSEVLEEEILQEGTFGLKCRADYVQFDDGESTREDRAKFRAGHRGWQYGGKIVLLDEDDQPYTVLVNRLNRTVELVEGDVGLPLPKDKESMVF